MLTMLIRSLPPDQPSLAGENIKDLDDFLFQAVCVLCRLLTEVTYFTISPRPHGVTQ